MWQWRFEDPTTHPGQIAGRRGQAAERVQRGRRGLVSPRHRRRHNRAGVVSRRRRRRLVHQLRRAAAVRAERDPVRRRHVCLLIDRVAATRPQLLELAALVSHSSALDATSEAELRRLLTSGCDSPLYQDKIHISELYATLYFLRSRIARA